MEEIENMFNWKNQGAWVALLIEDTVTELGSWQWG